MVPGFYPLLESPRCYSFFFNSEQIWVALTQVIRQQGIPRSRLAVEFCSCCWYFLSVGCRPAAQAALLLTDKPVVTQCCAFCQMCLLHFVCMCLPGGNSQNSKLKNCSHYLWQRLTFFATFFATKTQNTHSFSNAGSVWDWDFVLWNYWTEFQAVAAPYAKWKLPH